MTGKEVFIIPNRTELPFSPSRGYTGFADMSGGIKDAAALAITHVEPGTRAQHAVLDQLIVVPAPHEPHEACARFAAVLQRFGIRHVTGDRYGSGFVIDAFRQHAIRYEASTLDKSAIYNETSHLFAEKRVELLDDRRLHTQLRLLERRPRTGGRGDSVDHPTNAHDDAANAVCGALGLASSKPARYPGPRSRPEYSLT